MSGTMQIPASEAGVIRLFKVNLTQAEIAPFSEEPQGDERSPISTALGTDTLTASGTQIFPVSDLAGVGLAQYLIDGHAIPEDQINPMRPQLDAITGHVLLVFSSAFAGAPTTLTPIAPLHHVATFFEEMPPVTFEALPDESAQHQTPEPEKPRKQVSDAAMSGRIATVALLVAFGVAAMMVWMAG